MTPIKRVFELIVLTWFLFPALAVATDPSGTWKQVDDSDGIRVLRLEVPGRDLPGFRGEAVIEADLKAIAAVLLRVDAHTEWMHRCAESQVLEEVGPEHVVVYNRTDAPWPVWDRDVILDTQFTHDAREHSAVLSFRNTVSTRRAVPVHVVRMPRLEGFYKLWQVAPGRTRVVYQVEVDIGGSVPKFVAERIARDMPYETLRRLRARATAANR